MDSGSVTRGSPAGCVVGTFAILAFIFSIASGFLVWKALQTPPEKRPEDFLLIPLACLILGILTTAASAWISVRMLASTDWKSYDSDDPSAQM